MADAAQSKPVRVWTRRATRHSLHYYESDDRWALYYESYPSVPRWTIGDFHTGRAHSNGYNAQLGADDDDAALAWANSVLDGGPGPTLHPRHLGSSN